MINIMTFIDCVIITHTIQQVNFLLYKKAETLSVIKFKSPITKRDYDSILTQIRDLKAYRG